MAFKWLKEKIMKKFNIKDLRKVKTIIAEEIIGDIIEGTIKIN